MATERLDNRFSTILISHEFGHIVIQLLFSEIGLKYSEIVKVEISKRVDVSTSKANGKVDAERRLQSIVDKLIGNPSQKQILTKEEIEALKKYALPTLIGFLSGYAFQSKVVDVLQDKFEKLLTKVNGSEDETAINILMTAIHLGLKVKLPFSYYIKLGEELCKFIDDNLGVFRDIFENTIYAFEIDNSCIQEDSGRQTVQIKGDDLERMLFLITQQLKEEKQLVERFEVWFSSKQTDFLSKLK